MATLTGQSIDSSYQGLIKTTDNGAITATPKAVTDGTGNATNIEISNTATNFVSGTVDFTGSTVSGIDTGVASVVAGTNVTVDNTDPANPIISAAGGGGGAALVSMQNQEGRTYYDSNSSGLVDQYRTWVNTTGYGTATAAVSQRAAYALFTMVPGEDINKVAIKVQAAGAGVTGEIAFYDIAVNSAGFIYVNNRLQSLGTVDMSSTGWKDITLGTPYTVPSGLTNNTIAILAFPSATSANFGGWSNSMAMVGQGIFLVGGTPYRSLHQHVNPGVAPGTALPAVIGDANVAGGSVDYKASTSNPLAVMIN